MHHVPVVTGARGGAVTYDNAEKFVKRIVSLIGLNSTEYSTHSDRHGAVAEMILEGRSKPYIKNFGNWRSTEGLERYTNATNPDLIQMGIIPAVYKAEREKQGRKAISDL